MFEINATDTTPDVTNWCTPQLLNVRTPILILYIDEARNCEFLMRPEIASFARHWHAMHAPAWK
ncbi:MAG: hypothetical protein EBT78_13515 [Betaproteobacteria bacterium]|nr:hypothetical protein [Betaproteobacteria bacterium]